MRTLNPKLLLIVPALLLSACQSRFERNDLKTIAGQWEIDYVKLKDGSRRDYPINESIEIFTLKGDQGMRQKVMPMWDGSLRQLTPPESFELTIDNGQVTFHYASAYAKWKEELVALDQEALVVRNSENEYHYKHPQPLNLKDGQTKE